MISPGHYLTSLVSQPIKTFGAEPRLQRHLHKQEKDLVEVIKVEIATKIYKLRETLYGSPIRGHRSAGPHGVSSTILYIQHVPKQ